MLLYADIHIIPLFFKRGGLYAYYCMSSRFVTQAVEEKIPIAMVCPPGAFRTSLGLVLDTAGFRAGELHEAERPYLVIVVALAPLSATQVRLLGHLGASVNVYVIRFDITDPEWVSRLPKHTQLRYEGVFSPDKEPLSRLQERVRQVVWGGNEVGEGKCAPLWYEDVCRHIAQELLTGTTKDGVFRGELLSSTQLIEALRQELGVGKEKGTVSVLLPTPEGALIPGRTGKALLDCIIQDLEAFAPIPTTKNETHQAVVVEPKPSVVSPRIKKTIQRRRIKQRVRTVLLGVSCLFGIIGGLGLAGYQMEMRLLASDVRSLVYEERGRVTTVSLSQSQKRVARMGMVTQAWDSMTSWTQPGKKNDTSEGLSLLATGLEGYSQLEEAVSKLTQAYEVLMGEGKGDSLAIFKDADGNLDEAYKNFSLLQARLAQDDLLFPPELGGKEIQEQLGAKLPTVRKDIMTLRSVVGVLPELLGQEKQKNYALVLTDSTALRGTGGRVIAVAVVSFDKGKLLTQQTYSVEALTTMFTGNVTAPDEVRQFLRMPTWTLSDSTWDISSKKTTQQVSWFLGKALSRSIDGVFLLPSTSMPAILGATGSLQLSDTKGEVSEQTFVSQVEGHIARLSQDPKALALFYVDVFSSLVGEIEHAKGERVGTLISSLYTQLSTAAAFVGIGSPEPARIFSALTWDGAILSPACPPAFSESVCRVSTVYAAENTLGQNHVNIFVKRSHVHTIRVGEDVLLHNRLITLTNSSSLLAWPYGAYQSLVKLAVDEHAQVQGVSVNDQALTPDKFSLLKSDGKLVVRLLVDVPPSVTIRIRVTYTTPGIPVRNSNLVFFEQKQLGTKSDPFTLIVTYPEQYAPRSVAPRADVGRASLSFTSSHDGNHLFGIGF